MAGDWPVMLDPKIAPNARGLECLRALQAGIPLELSDTGASVTGVCGCGHPFVARSYEAAHAALSAHFSARVSQ